MMFLEKVIGKRWYMFNVSENARNFHKLNFMMNYSIPKHYDLLIS